MTQHRLNHLMILHIHKELTDNIDMLKAANDFVAGSEHRLTIFGEFKSSDFKPDSGYCIRRACGKLLQCVSCKS